MDELRYTLITDGKSDQVLVPILTWLLKEHQVDLPIQPSWADLSRLPYPPKGLTKRIKWALELYPCDLLFVHRDAEKESCDFRVAEINKNLRGVSPTVSIPVVCVVPVRMHEAWLLFDEKALRTAAGNPSGKDPLQLPAMNSIESMLDPKQKLYDLLKAVSGLRGRRLARLQESDHARRVVDYIDDFTPLRALPAFRVLESEIERIVTIHGWCLDSHSDTKRVTGLT